MADASVQYDTFTRSETFEMMAFIGGQGPSFENPHNGVHDLAGCSNGTLEDLNWSAFDPLLYVFLHFFLSNARSYLARADLVEFSRYSKIGA